MESGKLYFSLVLLHMFCIHYKTCDVAIQKYRDFNIAVYLPLCLKDGLTINSLMLLEAVEYYTNLHDKFLKYTELHLGYVLYDSCYDSAETLKSIIDTTILNLPYQVNSTDSGGRSCSCSNSSQPYIIGVVTSLSRYNTALIANVFLVSGEKLISISTDSPRHDTHENYYRILTDDATTFLVYKAMIHFYGWKNVGIVLSDNAYGEIGSSAALKYFENSKFCLSFTAYFPSKGADEMMLQLKRHTHLDATILWLTSDDSTRFFTSAGKHKIQNRTWIASPLIAQLPLSYFQQFNIQTIQGMIFISLDNPFFRNTKDSNFTTYFWSVTQQQVRNRWWQNMTFSKNFTEGGINQIKSQITAGTYTTVKTLSYAMKSFYFDLNLVMAVNLNKSAYHIFKLYRSGKLVQNALLILGTVVDYGNISILQAKKSRVTLKYISSFLKLWNAVVVYTAKNSTYAPKSLCQDECEPGFYPIFINTDCCWICRRCEIGFIKVKIGNKNCVKCPQNKESNKNRTICLSYRLIYSSYHSRTAYILYSLVSTGFLFNTFTLFSFLKYRKTPVVRASNSSLSFTQLIAHALLFLGPLSMIGNVDNVSCLVLLFLHGFLICLIQGIIFAKTVFLVMIFKSKTAPQNTNRTRSLQYSIVVVLQVFYCCIAAAIITQSPNGIKMFRNKDELSNKIICGNSNLILFQLLYVLFLTLLCMVQAFRARKLPTYFNEAKCILYAAFGCFVVSMMSGLLYNSLADADSMMLLFHTMMFLLNLCSLTCMFGPKLWIMLLEPEKNDIRVLQKAVYKSVEKQVELHAQRRTNTDC